MQASTNLLHQLRFCSLKDRFQHGEGALLRQVEVELGINFTDFGLNTCLVVMAAGEGSLDFCLCVHLKVVTTYGVRVQASKLKAVSAVERPMRT